MQSGCVRSTPKTLNQPSQQGILAPLSPFHSWTRSLFHFSFFFPAAKPSHIPLRLVVWAHGPIRPSSYYPSSSFSGSACYFSRFRDRTHASKWVSQCVFPADLHRTQGKGANYRFLAMKSFPECVSQKFCAVCRFLKHLSFMRQPRVLVFLHLYLSERFRRQMKQMTSITVRGVWVVCPPPSLLLFSTSEHVPCSCRRGK